MGKNKRVFRKEKNPLPPLPVEIVEYYNNGEYDLYVAPSILKDAGMGLFTREEIEKDTIIGYYSGEIKSVDSMPYHHAYRFELNERYYIDGYLNPRCMMAMINDSRFSLNDHNCDFHLNYNPETISPNAFHDQLVSIITLRYISPNEELFIDYGPDYWR